MACENGGNFVLFSAFPNKSEWTTTFVSIVKEAINLMTNSKIAGAFAQRWKLFGDDLQRKSALYINMIYILFRAP